MRHNKENQSPLSPSPSMSKLSDQDPGVEETSYHQSGMESTKISLKKLEVNNKQKPRNIPFSKRKNQIHQKVQNNRILIKIHRFNIKFRVNQNNIYLLNLFSSKRYLTTCLQLPVQPVRIGHHSDILQNFTEETEKPGSTNITNQFT